MLRARGNESEEALANGLFPEDPAGMTPPTPRRPQVPQGPPADDVDRALVDLLLADGRMPNAELARRTGIAESTCSARVRALRERGVLRGVHAEIDHAALGRPLEALVALRFSGHSRTDVDRFRARVVGIPGVVAAFHVTGANDFLVQVCAESPDALRDVVLDRLTTLPGVVHAETSLVYERLRGIRPLG